MQYSAAITSAIITLNKTKCCEICPSFFRCSYKREHLGSGETRIQNSVSSIIIISIRPLLTAVIQAFAINLISGDQGNISLKYFQM